MKKVALLPLFLFVGCDEPGEPETPPPADPPVEADGNSVTPVARVEPAIPLFEEGELVIEYSSHSHFGGYQGWRIFADGRYETIAPPGPEHERHAREPVWEPLRSLSAAELQAFYQLMYSYDLASLENEYAPEQRVMDGASGHWNLRLVGGPKHVVVRAGVTVAALEAIWEAMPTAVIHGESTADIALMLGQRELDLHLPCSPSVPEDLAAFTTTLAADGQERAEGGPGDGAAKLLDIVYYEDGVRTSNQELWSDGWQLIRDTEGGVDRYEHSAAQLDGYRAALEAMDWTGMSQRCPEKD